MKPMKIIVGLGNPGKKYERTRHNIGVLAVDALARALHMPGFKINKRLQALVTDEVIHEQRVIIIKPQTFMNLSGASVAPFLKKQRGAKLSDCIIVFDDLDLPFGIIRYRTRGSAGGHNGMKSVITSLGSQEIPRIKIGIRPPALARQPGKAEDFVLEKFSAEEFSALQQQVVPQAVRLMMEKLETGI